MEDNKAALEEYNAWRISQGHKPIEEAPPVPNGVRSPKRAHFINLTEEAWTGLGIIAHENGYSSVAAFVEAIGVRKWPG